MGKEAFILIDEGCEGSEAFSHGMERHKEEYLAIMGYLHISGICREV